MFSKGTNFSAVLFKNKSLCTAQKLYSIFPEDIISTPKQINNKNEVSIDHFYYYSESKFVRREDILNKIETEDGRYKYNFYFISFKLEDEYFSVLAVPWFKMGVELINYLAPTSLKFDLIEKYHQTDLLGLIKSLKKDRDDNITLLSSTLTIEGESNVSKLLISGSNPLYSELFDSIDDLVKFQPNQCQIIHEEDGTPDFRLLLDSFGNMTFRINSTFENLYKLKSIFQIMLNRNILQEIDGYYNPMKLRLGIKEDINE